MNDLDELDEILLPTAQKIAGEWGDAEMGKDALPYVHNLKTQLNQYVSRQEIEARLDELEDLQTFYDHLLPKVIQEHIDKLEATLEATAQEKKK